MHGEAKGMTLSLCFWPIGSGKNWTQRGRQPAFCPIGYKENLEQPRAFLVEIFEFFGNHLNLEDLNAGKSPSYANICVLVQM